jgi:predicted nucleotidyltransferase
MKIKDALHGRLSEFTALCSQHNVNNLYAFGSSVNGNFNETSSDIDLLVDIDDKDPLLRGQKLLDFWDKLEDFFQKKVDLLTYSSLKNPVLKKNIDASKLLIYDGKRQEVYF